MDLEKSIFLLGGHDLEMQEIARILDEHGTPYCDRDLSWGNAKLAAYADIIEKHIDDMIYAVELNIDEENDPLYLQHKSHIHIIDHHGKAYADKPSSLLQVLQLLDKQPSRDQTLISASDSGYISGMKCLDATEEEIEDIRRRDRAAQGVTKDVYARAFKEVDKLKEKNNVNVLHTSFQRFTPLTDALYFQKDIDASSSRTIIYNDNEVVFYGFCIEKLEALMKQYKITQDSYYYGGKSNYFGLKEGILDKGQIETLIEDALSVPHTAAPVSSHIFMFPFRFDYMDKFDKDFHREYDFYESKSIKERIHLESLLSKLNHKDSLWHYRPFDLKKSLEEKQVKYYNEFAYFYDYAREALYNMQDDAKVNNEISYYFEHKNFNTDDKSNNRWIIDTGGGKYYNLQIEGISLRIFHTGVAVLAIELDNYDYKSFADIKAINEYCRRFYPQYLSLDDDDCITNPHFLSKSVTVKQNNVIKITESFKPTPDNITVGDNEIRVGKHIMTLLGKCFTQDRSKKDTFYIQPMLDDRMFVLSWYGNDTMASRLTRKNVYADRDEWYEYVFVDQAGEASVKNDWMKNDLLYRATYDRWSKYGTLFGISRYSFVVLTDAGDFGTDTIRIHLTTMYFQMMMLLLVQRASILRFSDEIAPLADLDNPTKEERLGDLYARYLSFYNRLYFREVTHQDQGIELYDMGLKQMKIVEHINKLDGKFKKLHDFANLKASERESEIAKEESKKMNRLTVLGSIFAVPSVVATIFDVDILNPYKEFALLLSIFLGSYVAYVMVKQKETKKAWKRIVVASLVFLSVNYFFNGFYMDDIKPLLVKYLGGFKQALIGAMHYLKLI